MAQRIVDAEAVRSSAVWQSYNADMAGKAILRAIRQARADRQRRRPVSVVYQRSAPQFGGEVTKERMCIEATEAALKRDGLTEFEFMQETAKNESGLLSTEVTTKHGLSNFAAFQTE